MGISKSGNKFDVMSVFCNEKYFLIKLLIWKELHVSETRDRQDRFDPIGVLDDIMKNIKWWKYYPEKAQKKRNSDRVNTKLRIKNHFFLLNFTFLT